jgi:hypothetical protein
VFVALGFWSCPQLAQTCSFPGRAQPCRCAPSSGEGQFSAWVCD